MIEIPALVAEVDIGVEVVVVVVVVVVLEIFEMGVVLIDIVWVGRVEIVFNVD